MSGQRTLLRNRVRERIDDARMVAASTLPIIATQGFGLGEGIRFGRVMSVERNHPRVHESTGHGGRLLRQVQCKPLGAGYRTMIGMRQLSFFYPSLAPPDSKRKHLRVLLMQRCRSVHPDKSTDTLLRAIASKFDFCHFSIAPFHIFV